MTTYTVWCMWIDRSEILATLTSADCAVSAEHACEIAARRGWVSGLGYERRYLGLHAVPIATKDHEQASGALCVDDGTGCCSVCGVEMTTCDACKGIGYHRALCPELDETGALDSIRAELARDLERADLMAYRRALDRCDEDLLTAIRSLGFAGRDSLADAERRLLLDAIRPTLRRIASDTLEVGP